ncbi:MAG TPA: large conductance mechanosensitive channel protein MscL [Terracidiphilus sp.]
MLKGFRDFILRGNVVDLAVAVIIGAAFGGIVTSLVSDVITPLIAGTVGQPDFSHVIFHVGKGEVKLGNFLDHVISFLIIATVVYFGMVVPINALLNRFKKPIPPAPPVTKACPECLSDIPVAAKRCSHCGQPVVLTAAV